MPSTKETGAGRPQPGEDLRSSPNAAPDHGENSASTVIESPQKPGQRDKLDPHDFPDGGGSGGAAKFSRKTLRLKK